MLAGSTGSQDAIANGDTRTLTFLHMHRKDTLTVTFRSWGSYDSSALSQLNHFLRDWRNDQSTRMDPKLFDVIWEVTRRTGSTGPVQVLSAYRSPTTNAMLARRSRGVAKTSQHIAGRAIDIRLTDVNMRQAREVAVQMQHGGVGFYPSSHTPFMHVDVGSVRSWPRLTRDQLARLFPDGKTVHLPADGQPMPGYEQARAEIVARGGAVTFAEAPDAFGGKRKSLWATLFGGADEEEDVEEARNTRRGPAARRGAPTQRVAVAAPTYAAPSPGDDAGVHTFFASPQAPAPSPVAVAVAPTSRLALRGQPAPAAVAPEAPATPAPAVVVATPPLNNASPPGAKPVQLAALPKTWLPSSAPLPASRPRDLTALAALEDDKVSPGKLVKVPLPPSRPADLPVETAVAVAPEPKPVVVAHPAPPSRPDTSPLAFASLAPAAAKPDLPPAIRGLSPPKPPAKSTVPTDLKMLVTSVLATTPAPAAAPVRTAKVRVETPDAPPVVTTAPPGKGVRASFGAGVDTDLVTGSFTGPAVKPVPALGFAR